MKQRGRTIVTSVVTGDDDVVERQVAISAMRKHLKISQGIGGTFDVIAGRVRRVPAAFRAVHLEWFCRLVTNPQPLHRKTAMPRFALHMLKQREME